VCNRAIIALKVKMSRELIILSDSFYARNTLDIASDLLGKYLVRKIGKRRWVGRIVEVEAYIGEKDPACHAFRGLTPRTRVMYGRPGHAYVYFTYGMHFMLNIVTEREGYPAAVLVRALEPVEGFSGKDPRPTNGPGKLCKNMYIDQKLNGISLTSGQLWVGSNSGNSIGFEIRWSPRIGIVSGTEKLWRAYIYGNEHTSRKSNPRDAKKPTLRLYD